MYVSGRPVFSPHLTFFRGKRRCHADCLGNCLFSKKSAHKHVYIRRGRNQEQRSNPNEEVLKARTWKGLSGFPGILEEPL